MYAKTLFLHVVLFLYWHPSHKKHLKFHQLDLLCIFWSVSALIQDHLPHMQPQLNIFIRLFNTGQCLSSKFLSQEQEDDNKVIIIDQDGTSDLQCCMYGKCLCSNISLALEYLQDDTKIRIQSDISLHNIVVFRNVWNVKLAGDSNYYGNHMSPKLMATNDLLVH